MRLWKFGVIVAGVLAIVAGSVVWQSHDAIRLPSASSAGPRPAPLQAWPGAPAGRPWSQPACIAPAPVAGEVQGTAGGGHTIWGLILGPLPVQPGSRTKVIVRMTGRGAPAVYADGPDGRRIAPDLGPEGRAGSSWNRPGDEWAAFFTFPTPGCWNIRVARAALLGTVPLRVLDGDAQSG